MDKEFENIENIDSSEDIETSIESSIETPIENAVENISQDAIEEIEAEEIIKEDIKDGNQNNLIAVRPVQFQEFEKTEPNRAIKKNLDILQDIQMHVSVELGKSKLSIKEVMDMEKGSIVELDKIAGEQVEIYVNQKLVARGEVIVIEDKFGVRVVSTNLPKPTI